MVKRLILRCERTIYPGMNGAKKLHDEYGNRLLTVRYRIDKTRKIRYKTVELIIERRPLRKRKRR
jgi:hypothetical protein